MISLRRFMPESAVPVPPARTPRIAAALAGMPALALAVALALAGCTSGVPVEPVAERDGVEITLRGERNPPRLPPGPEYERVTAANVQRSLERLVVRYAEVFILNLTDPVPLLSAAQVAVMRDAIAERLPDFPPDKRLGFEFRDRFQGFENEVEVYPEGEYLVYEFRKLMFLKREEVGRGDPGMNRAFIFKQPDQVVEEAGRTVIVKDRVLSAARPVLEKREEGRGEEQIF